MPRRRIKRSKSLTNATTLLELSTSMRRTTSIWKTILKCIKLGEATNTSSDSNSPSKFSCKKDCKDDSQNEESTLHDWCHWWRLFVAKASNWVHRGYWVHRGTGSTASSGSTGSMTGAVSPMTGPQAIPDEKDVEFTGPAGDLQVSSEHGTEGNVIGNAKKILKKLRFNDKEAKVRCYRTWKA